MLITMICKNEPQIGEYFERVNLKWREYKYG